VVRLADRYTAFEDCGAGDGGMSLLRLKCKSLTARSGFCDARWRATYASNFFRNTVRPVSNPLPNRIKLDGSGTGLSNDWKLNL
jgi:hypothetical protein